MSDNFSNYIETLAKQIGTELKIENGICSLTSEDERYAFHLYNITPEDIVFFSVINHKIDLESAKIFLYDNMFSSKNRARIALFDDDKIIVWSQYALKDLDATLSEEALTQLIYKIESVLTLIHTSEDTPQATIEKELSSQEIFNIKNMS